MPLDKAILKDQCLNSHEVFARYFFKYREGTKFTMQPYHKLLCDVVDRVFTGEIKNLIINVPPGYSKTELIVINLVARGFAINPSSRFIHTSYSQELVNENSMKIKDLMLSEEYQQLFNYTFRKDKSSKSLWELDEHGGMFLAASTGGSITGFRAGRMQEGFTGCIIIDDPLKPDDGYSAPRRTTVNERLISTVQSRKIHPEIPTIIIMQRLHEQDPSGFFLEGGNGEQWHHLNLPAEIKADYKYPAKFKYGIPIEHNLKPGMLWPQKHTIEILNRMRKSSPNFAASQYDQSPSPLGGSFFKEKWFQYYDMLPELDYRFITCDTAQKVKQHNDYSAMGCFGIKNNCIYVIDIIRGKWEAPDLEIKFEQFLNKHHHPGATTGTLRAVYIEDKVSGTSLIQSQARKSPIPIIPIQRNTDKVLRANDTQPFLSSQRIYLPKQGEWVFDFVQELISFTELLTHKNDDMVDVFMDAVEIGLMQKANRAGTF